MTIKSTVTISTATLVAELRDRQLLEPAQLDAVTQELLNRAVDQTEIQLQGRLPLPAGRDADGVGARAGPDEFVFPLHLVGSVKVIVEE